MNQKVCSKFWADITSINADASKPESPGHVFLNPAKGDTSRYHRSCVDTTRDIMVISPLLPRKSLKNSFHYNISSHIDKTR